MFDYQKAKDFLEYTRQEQIKRFGTDKLLLPFEPRFPFDSTLLKKDLIKLIKSTELTE